MTQVNTQRVLYVKTPKTAGTSIVKVLTDVYGSALRIDGKSVVWPRPSVLEEAPLLVIGDVIAKRFCKKYPKLWSKRYKLAAVRNPYTKTMSAWRYCGSTKNLTLENALGTGMPRPSWRRRYDHDYVHFALPQSEFLVKDGKLIVDHLIRYESMQADLDAAIGRTGKPSVEIPILNKTKNPADGNKELTAQAIAKINKIFRSDFETFGYEMMSPKE